MTIMAVIRSGSSRIPGERLVRILKDIILENGKPNNIRCDNGPEFISKVFHEWCPIA